MQWLGLVIRCISLLQFSFKVVCTCAQQAKPGAVEPEYWAIYSFSALWYKMLSSILKENWTHPLTEHTLFWHTSEIASALLRAFNIHWF